MHPLCLGREAFRRRMHANRRYVVRSNVSDELRYELARLFE